MFRIFVVMFSEFLLLYFLDFCCYVFCIFVVIFSVFFWYEFLDFFGINFWILRTAFLEINLDFFLKIILTWLIYLKEQMELL